MPEISASGKSRDRWPRLEVAELLPACPWRAFQTGKIVFDNRGIGVLRTPGRGLRASYTWRSQFFRLR